MAEKTTTYPQNVTHQGRFVSPLDNPRSFDKRYLEISAAAAASGTVYYCMSGHWAYIHQVLACEYSGNTGAGIQLVDPGHLDLSDGKVTPMIPIDPNSCVALQWCGCPLGPFTASGTYGNAGQINYNTDGAFYGGITLIVQIDPHMEE